MEKTNGGNLIQIKNLVATVNLNNGDTLVTVNKANMELKRGNSYAIVGKSGSGKTSLISIIGLLNHSYQGEFLYNGMSVSTLTDSQLSMLRASNIGFVFQNYSLIKHLRVWENIELPLLYSKKKMNTRQRKEAIRNLLQSVGLEGKENDYPSNLSGGEQQRVAIAPVASVSSLQDISDTVYKKTVPVDVVFTTSTYNKIYNLPMSSGDWFDSSEINKTLCMVVNKAAQNYFDTSYAVGNVESSLSLTPFNVVGTVNDGTDIPTVYLDAHSIELLVPNMWKVKNATVHWHSEAGITMRQMYSSLHDILEDTIGGNLDIIGKSDIGDTYNSVLSVLQLGLLVTSFLLLFVSVLGQINIGLSSLEQRTHELLIRRAIGASRANIVTLVLGAQLTISVSVCIVSILISFFLVQGMGLFLPVDSPVAALEYPILSAVVAVITSVVVALLGGLLPALKAAKLELFLTKHQNITMKMLKVSRQVPYLMTII